jgi:hypothetical protein
MAQKKRGPKQVTDAHKAAMATGRSESRIVGAYLEALEAHRPKRGRKRTAQTVSARLEAIESEFDEADMLTRVNLVQERMNLEAELAAFDEADVLAEAQAAFIECASSYSERRGITWSAWREIGVPPEVLREAGVRR